MFLVLGFPFGSQIVKLSHQIMNFNLTLQILSSNNVYIILNVAQDASIAEIKKSYHQLALIYHPDKCKEEFAEEVFKKINSAYLKVKAFEKKQAANPFQQPFENWEPKKPVKSPTETLHKAKSMFSTSYQKVFVAPNSKSTTSDFSDFECNMYN